MSDNERDLDRLREALVELFTFYYLTPKDVKTEIRSAWEEACNRRKELGMGELDSWKA